MANLTLSQHFWRSKRKKICIYSLQPGHLEAEQNDKKVKRSKIKTKGVKSREVLVQASSACENHRFVVAKWPRLEKKLNNVYIQKYELTFSQGKVYCYIKLINSRHVSYIKLVYINCIKKILKRYKIQ